MTGVCTSPARACVHPSEHIPRRAYCSDACERRDGAPSSASSSACSSPALGPSRTGTHDVPALLPHALGRALRRTSAYALSSDDDDDEHRVYLSAPAQPKGLTYARRPSGTNHRSTIPILLGGPTAPTRAPYAPSDLESDAGSPPRITPKDRDATVNKSAAARRRNRASLPAHFRLLGPAPAPPVVSACFASGTPAAPAPELAARPRGRRRETGEPCVADGRIRSCSRERYHRAASAQPARYDPDADASELELDWDEARPPVVTRQAAPTMERGRWREPSRDAYAPGYGQGRSGLRDRSRAESPFARGRTAAVGS
jgi:hypothetical protein